MVSLLSLKIKCRSGGMELWVPTDTITYLWYNIRSEPLKMGLQTYDAFRSRRVENSGIKREVVSGLRRSFGMFVLKVQGVLSQSNEIGKQKRVQFDQYVIWGCRQAGILQKAPIFLSETVIPVMIWSFGGFIQERKHETACLFFNSRGTWQNTKTANHLNLSW